MAITIDKSRLAAIVAAMRAKNAQKPADTDTDSNQPILTLPSNPEPDYSHILDKYGKPITLNAKQLEFVELAGSGQSAVLIGAAGTGKTTCQKAVIQKLILSGKAGILHPNGHKYLTEGTPGIVVCAFTRRAVANIRRNVPETVTANCITIHKLLEYQPEYYEISDEATGETKTKMRFAPNRNFANPLPTSIRTIVIEEGSMLGLDLWEELLAACQHEIQFIFLGDIEQLAPVFGPAILGFKLLELPVVQLTEVYRQALESPIISLAHRILSGKGIPAEELKTMNVPGQLKFTLWAKKIDAHNALNTMVNFFTRAIDSNSFDPEEDMILIPFNKSFGTDELNKGIANHLARRRGATTHEIIAGFNKAYYSVGDKVMHDKEDAEIIKIEKNETYTGAKFSPASATLDYWGFDPVTQVEEEDDDYDVDFILEQVAKSDGDRVHQASHIITLRMTDSDIEVKLDKASEVNSLALGYALTVHKAQGSEFRRVFFVAHQSHATMLQRELLYTAVTRAREELYVICEPDTFVKGIASQKIKGNSLEEKAEYFKGKAKERSGT